VTEGVGSGRPACNLWKLPQMAYLPAEMRDALQGICRSRSYTRGATIVHAGQNSDTVGFVFEGILRMQKTLADGRQHIVGLLFQGDMFGRVFDGPAIFDLEAATDVRLCMLERGPFEKLLSTSPELDRLVLLNMLNELDRARDWLLVLANPRITSRVAGFLLMLCTKLGNVEGVLRSRGGRVEVGIPIGRTDLAHLLGTRHESISRAFHALADAGTIAIVKPDLVEILDFDELCAEAGDEDAGEHGSLKDLMRLQRFRRA